MNRPVLCRIAVAMVLAFAIIGPLTLVGHAFSAGPPLGATGAPGEGTCNGCHGFGGFPLNSGTASLGITGPLFVGPGGSYAMTVSFSGATGPKHGFQIVAYDSTGTQSGTWTVTSPGNTASTAGFYHGHTAAGTALTTWPMTWNAPTTLPSGNVTFYACGIEANDNGNSQGDYAYTAKRKIPQMVIIPDLPIPWPVGAQHYVAVLAPTRPGDLYFLVPSFNPMPFSLGFLGAGPLELEVTPDDLFSLVTQYPQYFQNFIGVLDGAGQATATMDIPNVPGLSGLQFHLAALTYSPVTNTVTEVSNRETITLL